MVPSETVDACESWIAVTHNAISKIVNSARLTQRIASARVHQLTKTSPKPTYAAAPQTIPRSGRSNLDGQQFCKCFVIPCRITVQLAKNL